MIRQWTIKKCIHSFSWFKYIFRVKKFYGVVKARENKNEDIQRGKTQEIRWTDDIDLINLPKHHYSKMNDDKAIISCKKCI